MRLAKKRVALIGECLVEFNGTPFGALYQTLGGDTLNTAVYLSRIAGTTVDVKYITVLGTDALSDGMLQRWQAEGIDTSLVLRDPTRLPGVYWIQVDEGGERTFLYWRESSAARYLLRHPDFDRIAIELAKLDLVYLSGITLTILSNEDRQLLLQLLRHLTTQGVDLAFDTNYRSALWSSISSAREAISTLLPETRLIFATFDDEQRLWGDETPETTLARLRSSKAQTIVIKLGAKGSLHREGTVVSKLGAAPVATIVDTTAAGDAFNAGFLAGWLAERKPDECCVAGNTLASVVIQHRGAIIPASATPTYPTAHA
jgi:2-dehydro-3-deoxygluconokinase